MLRPRAVIGSYQEQGITIQVAATPRVLAAVAKAMQEDEDERRASEEKFQAQLLAERVM